MNTARLALVGVAIAAGGGALYLLSGDPPPQAPVVEVPLPKIDLQEVLTAAREIPIGTIISDLDLKWVVWPTAGIGLTMISKYADPAAAQNLKGSIARTSHMEGEPIRREKLVKGLNSGFLSAILPSGMRAVSMPIDGAGTTNAGGFVLPNDRVDVVRTFRSGDAGRSDIILSDIRVLAIGRSVQDQPGGDRTAQGPNATLEVTPEQAADLLVAQQAGGVSLVLRSLVDAGKPTLIDRDPPLSIIRYGVEAQFGKR